MHADFRAFLAGALVFPGVHSERAFHVDPASFFQAFAANLGLAVPDGDVDEELFLAPLAFSRRPRAAGDQRSSHTAVPEGVRRSSGSKVKLPIKKTLFKSAMPNPPRDQSPGTLLDGRRPCEIRSRAPVRRNPCFPPPRLLNACSPRRQNIKNRLERQGTREGRGSRPENPASCDFDFRSSIAAGCLFPARPAAEDSVRAGQRQAGDERGFEGQGSQVFGLEVVDVALAAGTGQDLDLGGQAWKKLATRSAAVSTSSRAVSSGSCVVIPTGQRPVWQWWHE